MLSEIGSPSKLRMRCTAMVVVVVVVLQSLVGQAWIGVL